MIIKLITGNNYNGYLIVDGDNNIYEATTDLDMSGHPTGTLRLKKLTIEDEQ